MSLGILWKNKNAYLLVAGGNGEYEVINGAWNLKLDENTLEGFCIAPGNTRVNLKFDKFTYLNDMFKYKTVDDYNEILNDANELGIDNHKDIDRVLENSKYIEPKNYDEVAF